MNKSTPKWIFHTGCIHTKNLSRYCDTANWFWVRLNSHKSLVAFTYDWDKHLRGVDVSVFSETYMSYLRFSSITQMWFQEQWHSRIAHKKLFCIIYSDLHTVLSLRWLPSPKHGVQGQKVYIQFYKAIKRKINSYSFCEAVWKECY